MKILLICTVPTEQSGIPNVIFNLLGPLSKSDVKFGYVSINNPSDIYKNKLKELGVELYIVPRKISNVFSYIKDLSQIAKSYDIVHVHGNSATMFIEMVAAKIGGVKVRIAHSHNTNCKMKFLDTLFRPLFYRLCNGRLACGEKAGEWLYHNKDFLIIKNGIDTDKFCFNQDKRLSIRKGLEWEKYVILANIANFVEAKNHEFLINVFSEIYKKRQDVRLLFLGAGPLMQDARYQARSLGIEDKILFLGSVPDIYNYVSAIDLIVMPSKFEGLPLTLVEEQANGLDAIVSDTITQDADLTGRLQFLPLIKGPEFWAETILSKIAEGINRTNVKSLDSIGKIKRKGYDIQTSANLLKDFYCNKFRIENNRMTS